MSEDINKLEDDELIAVEDSVLQGLLDAVEDNENSTQKIEIARNGKVLFSFNIRALTEKEYHDLHDEATKFRRAKNLGGVKVAEEVNRTRFRSLLIYHATIKEDRDKVWDNKQAWSQIGVLNGVSLIDRVLRAGEKDAVVEKIDEISGYSDELDDVIKNS